MAGDKHPRWIAAVSGDMGVHICQRLRAVFNKNGILNLRIKSIVCYDSDDPSAGEGLSEGEIIATLAGFPIAAVEEKKHRRRTFQLIWHINVELLARIDTKGDAVMDAIAGPRHQQVHCREGRTALNLNMEAPELYLRTSFHFGSPLRRILPSVIIFGRDAKISDHIFSETKGPTSLRRD